MQGPLISLIFNDELTEQQAYRTFPYDTEVQESQAVRSLPCSGGGGGGSGGGPRFALGCFFGIASTFLLYS